MDGILQISEEEYQADPCEKPSLSASIAKILIASTPLHAWTASPKLNPNFVREEKDIYDRGTVAHALLLQGIEKGVVLDFEDWRTKASKEQRDIIRIGGQIPILKKHWEAVKAMVERAREQLAVHKEAKNAFTNGKPEVTITWIDHATDGTEIICRSRIDWLHDDYLFLDDYKTVGRTANPEELSKIVYSDWAIQGCFYLRGLMAVTGKEATMRFIAQETDEPYALSVIGLGPDMLCIGQKQVQYAIDLWAKCLATNSWPGYPDRICYPILPEWAETAWLRKELGE